MKIKCKKCKAENNSTITVDPFDFSPSRVFICWYCKTRNLIRPTDEQDKKIWN